jgi:hypothetical protein
LALSAGAITGLGCAGTTLLKDVSLLRKETDDGMEWMRRVGRVQIGNEKIEKLGKAS